MNAEIKAKWIAALRSGQYTQAHYSLRNYTSHCCLGVLLDVAAPDLWAHAGGPFHQWSDDEGGLIEPEQVRLSLADQKALARLNDCERRSFAEIADFIEKSL